MNGMVLRRLLLHLTSSASVISFGQDDDAHQRAIGHRHRLEKRGRRERERKNKNKKKKKKKKKKLMQKATAKKSTSGR